MDEVRQMHTDVLGPRDQETSWDRLPGRYYKVSLSLFRFSERILQLGDISRSMQTRWGGSDDQCQLWKDEIRKMCEEIYGRGHQDNPRDGLRWGYYKVRIFNSGLVREYCNWETFSAQCKPGEVVLMTNASYGRMKYGRCISRTMDMDTKRPHEIGCAESIIQ